MYTTTTTTTHSNQNRTKGKVKKDAEKILLWMCIFLWNIKFGIYIFGTFLQHFHKRN
jgi:hypothetical protein